MVRSKKYIKRTSCLWCGSISHVRKSCNDCPANFKKSNIILNNSRRQAVQQNEVRGTNFKISSSHT
jgi:hypothetical protein